MKKITIFFLVIAANLSLFTACKRMGNDYTYISKAPVVSASGITSDTLKGTLKGTLVAGKTYYMDSAVTINAGDTLFIQSGVTINVINPYAFIHVMGTFISLGTATAPIWITVPGLTGSNKQDNVSAATTPSTDSAFTSARNWCGIACDTSCHLCVIKWTHIEFAGHNYNIAPIVGLKSPSWPVYFSSVNGYMIVEDSWFYGNVDDCIRFASGKICVMRNTFEKNGYTSGDCLNAKQGTVGIMAYNLFVGTCTNGTKASNKGASTTDPECQIDVYNNTYINGGWRQSSTAHGANIDYEQNARGQAYNNLIVNCKVGFRVVSNPVADTANLFYGNTYNYGDSISIVDQFYPPGNVTIPQSTDFPNPSTYLPGGYTLGAIYSADALAEQNNPMFVNYPLPCPSGYVIDYIGVGNANPYNFHLQTGSPAIGKGYTGFTPNVVVPIDPVYGATAITPPGADMGCYQSNGTGNQH